MQNTKGIAKQTLLMWRSEFGNVLSTVSDRKRAVAGAGGSIAYWQPEVVSCTDYYPFGMQMAGRSFASKGYRWGFQGQEEDRETGWVNYTYRMHDPRTGRFFAVDPLAGKYPYYSTYSFSGNRLLDAVELEGLEAVSYELRSDEIYRGFLRNNYDKNDIKEFHTGQAVGGLIGLAGLGVAYGGTALIPYASPQAYRITVQLQRYIKIGIETAMANPEVTSGAIGLGIGLSGVDDPALEHPFSSYRSFEVAKAIGEGIMNSEYLMQESINLLEDVNKIISLPDVPDEQFEPELAPVDNTGNSMKPIIHINDIKINDKEE